MAKISLRNYDREIENQIEAGHTDEAISHCRYILQQFPKHIDTYRLLGKAYLETKRYTEASDVLQRVLSSIPDDFVAHLGMSIIREDEGDLDAAIWHMERAFEVQPANAAIQNELRRLYGRRDGLEPPKVHLTRGALARMYAKGNLYRQAIAEIRTALAEDPQRPDLQVLLAQTYMETNQRVEAVETCSTLLNKFPHCLVANNILAKILPDTERASEAKIYRQRVEALDPYAAHLSPSSPAAEQVPDSAITLERHVWTPGEIVGGVPQPEWASTLGVEIEEEPELPDWLESDMEAPAESESPPPFFPEAEEETVSAEDLAPGEIPAWVRSMAPSSDMEEESLEAAIGGEEASQQPVQPFEFEEEAHTETPDWLRDMEAEVSEEIEQAPSDLGEPPEMEAFEKEEIPEWLAGEAFETPEAGAEMPEWLQELEEEAPPETQPEEAEMEVPEPAEAEAAQLEPVEEQLPDWLEEGGIEEPEEEIPEWLGELEAETEETVSAEAPEIEEQAEVSEPLYEAGEEPSPAVPSSQEDEDAALAWLESLAARQGADEEELLTSPEERQEAPPEWIEEIPAEEEGVFEEVMEPAESATEQGEVEAPEAQAPEEEVPEWIRAAELEGEAPEEAEEIPDWLHGAIEEGPPEEIEAIVEEEVEAIETAAQIPSPLEQEAPEAEALPDWLEEMGGEVPEAEVPSEEPAAYEGEFPDWLRDLGEEVEEPTEAEIEPEPILGDTQPVQVAPHEEEVEEFAEEPVSGPELVEAAEPGEEIAPEEMKMPSFDRTEEEAAMAWLESLAARQGVPEEELLTPVEQRTETPPEWVQEIEAEQAEAAAPEIVEAEEEISEAAPEIVEELPEEEILPPSEEEYEVTLIEEPQAEVTEEIQIPEVAEEEVAEEPGEIPAEPVEAMEEIPEYAMEEEEILPIEEAEAAPVEAAIEEEREILAEAEPEIEAEAEEIEPARPERREEAELPEWLSEFEMEVSAEEEEPVWQPEAAVSEEMPVEAVQIEEVEEEEAEEAEAPTEAAPTLININTASLAELERIPGIGFTMAQNIIAHRDTFGPFEEVEDLQQVSGIGPVTIEELKNWVTLESEEELFAAQEDPNQILLNEAREALSEGDIARAIEQYTDLIKGQQLLDEIVGDLLKAIDRHPVEISLYQALGDAYMRKDQLEEALDAYTRAEELLR